jgi:hypothetical protein
MEKYKDQLAELETQADKTSASPFDIVPLDLKVLLQSPETIEEEERALDLARQQIKERDEFESNKLRSIFSAWIVMSDARGRDRNMQSAPSSI